MSELITAEGLARLDAALAYIEAHPEEHDQDSWIRRAPDCGTTACIAGTLAQLAGGVPVWDPDYDDDEHADTVRLPDGVERVISRFATELLGVEIEGEIADDLFYGADNLAELRDVRNRIAKALAGSQETGVPPLSGIQESDR